MSMTINTGNYADIRFQNLRNSGVKKVDQDNSAEVGKTQESTVSASYDQVNMGKDGVAVAEVNRQQGAEQTGAKKASPYFDTVEISEEGKAASAQAQAQKTEAYEPEDLSEYTDTELKQMYYRGEITLQEYEDETGETLD